MAAAPKIRETIFRSDRAGMLGNPPKAKDRQNPIVKCQGPLKVVGTDRNVRQDAQALLAHGGPFLLRQWIEGPLQGRAKV
jgi:hypothetical protein